MSSNQHSNVKGHEKDLASENFKKKLIEEEIRAMKVKAGGKLDSIDLRKCDQKLFAKVKLSYL